MQQPQTIVVGGVVLGTTVQTHRGYHFIALNLRVEPVDRLDWARLPDIHRVARHLYLTGRLPERPVQSSAAAASLAASFCYRIGKDHPVSGLREYLVQKRTALQALQDRAASPDYVPVALSAHVRAEGRSGVRDFQVITDSPPDFAGYDLGPSSPELVLGALGSCLTHTWLIQAAAHDIPIDSLSVDVTGTIDARAGKPGHEHIPVYPHNIAYTVRVAAPVDRDRIDKLELAVERACPILNLLRTPQVIRAETEHLAT